MERQNHRLEQLAQIVSHDPRNPLNVLSGRIELARNTGDVSELCPAASALDRMNTMIEDMLQIAKHGQSVENSEMEEVSLREVAESSLKVVETQETNLEVVDDLLFEADRSRLRNIFENLFRMTSETVTSSLPQRWTNSFEGCKSGISLIKSFNFPRRTRYYSPT